VHPLLCGACRPVHGLCHFSGWMRPALDAACIECTGCRHRRLLALAARLDASGVSLLPLESVRGPQRQIETTTWRSCLS